MKEKKVANASKSKAATAFSNNSKQTFNPTDVARATTIDSAKLADSLTATSVDSVPAIDVNEASNIAKAAVIINHIDKSVTAVDNQTIPEQKFQLLNNLEYTLPKIELLKKFENNNSGINQDEITTNTRILEDTLLSFGIKVRVSEVHIGPTITKYELQVDAGQKISKISSLHNDLALSLAAKDIRIEAPIPGKAAVGIEVPNKTAKPIGLRDLLTSNNNNSELKLQVALGEDITGQAIFCELNKMPHILIAGSTGSGKSVCINTFVISILMKATPEDVKMIMIDPKKVELTQYDNLPHLLSPVVTDPLKASMILKKMVIEMTNRYDLFQSTKTKNIESYNAYAKNHEDVIKLPYIVIIIDELADLMLVAQNDVESSITRLAQMARAAGMHLVIATQRPSTDVITGLIKANIPARLSFSVASSIDSRTILDMTGAEKLLGRGDMLYLPQGESKPTRIQGAYLTDEEINDVVDSIKQQMQNINMADFYDEELLKESNIDVDPAIDDVDEQFIPACEIVIQNNKASVSLLQRKLGIGYNRAARIIDQMEALGVVGGHLGSKPREVLISDISQIEK